MYKWFIHSRINNNVQRNYICHIDSNLVFIVVFISTILNEALYVL